MDSIYHGHRLTTWFLWKEGIKLSDIHQLSAACVGRDRSVGIVTRYRLDGLGIESWWGGEVFCTRPDALGPTQPPIQWVLGLAQG